MQGYEGVYGTGSGQQGVSCPYLPIFADISDVRRFVWSLEIEERENG